MGGRHAGGDMQAFKSQDLWAGLIFAAIGALTLWTGADYQMGTSARMGPGYVPRLLGYGLLVFGAVIAARSLVMAGLPIAAGHLKPVLLILGGTALFGLLIDRAGLVITCAVVTIVTAYAAREKPNLLHVIALAVALSLACALLFVYGLRQAIPLWWDI
jgi:hypothetical protein